MHIRLVNMQASIVNYTFPTLPLLCMYIYVRSGWQQIMPCIRSCLLLSLSLIIDSVRLFLLCIAGQFCTQSLPHEPTRDSAVHKVIHLCTFTRFCYKSHIWYVYLLTQCTYTLFMYTLAYVLYHSIPLRNTGMHTHT